MTKHIVFLLTLALGFSSCSKPKSLSAYENPKVFVVSNLHIEKKSDDSLGNCQLRINCLQVDKGPSPLKDTVNHVVQQYFIDILHPGLSLDKAAQQYIDNCVNDQAKFKAPWTFVGESTVSFLGKGLLTVKCEFDMYSGGAHGIDGVDYKVFSLKTGRQLKPADFINDLPKFRDAMEANWRKQNNVAPDMDLRDIIFNVEHFPITTNMGFTNEGLVVHYNPYEIAPYAAGETAILVPWEIVGPFLK